MRLKFHKRSEVKFVSRIIPHAKPCGTCCWTNYPIAQSYWKLSRKAEGIADTRGYQVNIEFLEVFNPVAVYLSMEFQKHNSQIFFTFLSIALNISLKKVVKRSFPENTTAVIKSGKYCIFKQLR
jgi:hypothetical protein